MDVLRRTLMPSRVLSKLPPPAMARELNATGEPIYSEESNEIMALRRFHLDFVCDQGKSHFAFVSRIVVLPPFWDQTRQWNSIGRTKVDRSIRECGKGP